MTFRFAFLTLALATSTAFAMPELEKSTGAQNIAELMGVEPLAGQSCSSSFWCASWEHCVNGVCQPKDIFNRCDIFNPCSFGDECVNGVCQ